VCICVCVWKVASKLNCCVFACINEYVDDFSKSLKAGFGCC